MEKKYELTEETIIINNHVLHRIKSLKNFGPVEKDELGGFIESEENLSQEGDCWVFENAKVYGNAKIYDNAIVRSAESKIYGNAKIYGNTKIFGSVKISDNVQILGNNLILGNVIIKDNIVLKNDVEIIEDTTIRGNAVISSNYDIIIFRKFWTEKEEYIVYTRSNKMFSCGDFYGNEEEFIKHELNKDKENGINCSLFTEFIKVIK